MADRRVARVTIRDVAKEARVSIGTVSLALSDNPDVADETKRRVREIAVRLGYHASAAGQALRSGRMNAVALVIPHSGYHVFSHLYFMDVLAGMSAALNQAEMILLLSTAPTESDEDGAYVKILRSQMADGVVLASAALHDRNVDKLLRSGYPFVLIGRYPHEPLVHAVGVDDFGGAYQATLHLLDHGHIRIGHISGPEGHLSAVDRRQGYEAALKERSILPRPEYCVEGDYSEAAGRAGMERLLALADAPTALFAANDETALGAFDVLRGTGVEPGESFPVVGFDDTWIASRVTPPLTTVGQPMQQLGTEAAHLLLALLDGHAPEHRQRELPTKLVVRASCGCGAQGR